MLVDHREKCGCSIWFQVFLINCKSSDSCILTIAKAFNKPGAMRAVVLDKSKTVDRVWHAVILHKLKSYRILGYIFCLILSLLSNRQVRVALGGKSLQ